MLFFFPRGVLDGILNLIESVSEGFPSYFTRYIHMELKTTTKNVDDALRQVISTLFFPGYSFLYSTVLLPLNQAQNI